MSQQEKPPHDSDEPASSNLEHDSGSPQRESQPAPQPDSIPLTIGSRGDSEPDEAVIVAEIADIGGTIPDATSKNPMDATLMRQPKPAAMRRFHDVVSAQPVAANLDNISANGGAIGAIVLGIWSLIFAFVTNWSIINGFLGLLLGFWGLTSRKKRMAWIGICLCVLSIFLNVIQVSEWVSTYFNAVDEGSL